LHNSPLNMRRLC